MKTKFAHIAYRYFMVYGILSSLAVTICTIVDALLVGNLIGNKGLAVSNIATPVFLIYCLFGVTLGAGSNVKIGRLLGLGQVSDANKAFHNAFTIGLIIGLISLSPLLFKNSYFSFLGVANDLYPLANRYLTVVMWSAPIFILYHTLSFIVPTDGDPKCAAAASMAVIFINLGLDLVFMEVMKIGIMGASLSLCIAETIGLIILLSHFFKKQKLLTLRIETPTIEAIKDAAENGFGIGSSSIFGAIVIIVFNTLLMKTNTALGSFYVAIYAVLYTISTIPQGIFDGAAKALSTVTSFFTGESDSEGIQEIFKIGIESVAFFGIAATLSCFLFAPQIAGLFGITGSQSMVIATNAIRIFSICMLFSGINTVVISYWQAIGRAKLANALAIIRFFGLLLINGVIFIPKINILGVSLSFVLTELSCALITLAIGLKKPSKKFVAERYKPAGRTFEKSYQIDIESWETISRDIDAISESWDISMKESLFINFVCEEILLNIIKFGLDDKKKNYYISIKLMEKEDGYMLRIRDNVSLYNPFESNGDEIDNGVLTFIQRKAKVYDYQRKMIFNYLYIEL